MPTIVLISIAYLLKNIKWRYAFLILAVLNLIFNIARGWWAPEFYALVAAFLYSMLNPKVMDWWNKRKLATKASTFRQVATISWQRLVQNKYEIVFWIAILIIATAIFFEYNNYTGRTNLGWLTELCVDVFIIMKIVKSLIAPSFMPQDKSTKYVILATILAWATCLIIFREMGIHFMVPMVILFIVSIIAALTIRGKTRYLIPGCALILADLIWQIIRLFQNNDFFVAQVISSEILLVVVILIGLAWMLKKPGVFPIIFLLLFQLFRFSAFSFEAVDSAVSSTLTTPEVTFYLLYLVCWMFIAPLIFWFVGLQWYRKEVNKVTH